MRRIMKKIIPSYDGLYSVDSFGNVYSNRRNITMGVSLDRYGRERVHLYRNGVRKNKQVHRLVAETFLPDYSENLTVNHLDGNPRNNYVGNLEMCTVLQNLEHARLSGISDQRGVKHSQARLSEAEVIEIRRLSEENGMGLTALAGMFSINYRHVWQIIERKRWKHL